MQAIQEIARDARYALRGMRRAPGFTVVAVITLALGIGANTAIFSVLYGVWLAPAPYAQADRLVDLSEQQLGGHRFSGGTSYLNLADWKTQSTVVEGFGAHSYARQVNVTGAGEAEEVVAHRVSANLFDLLGARPVLGQWMSADGDGSAGTRQALIGYTWWMERLGGSTEVVGRRIFVDGEAYTIAGVMPRGFEFPPMGSDSYRPRIWMSLSPTVEREGQRDTHGLDVVARLKKGVSLARAQAEMDTIRSREEKAYPSEDGPWGIKVARLTDVRQLEEVRPALMLLMAAAGLVLLIACANIANLLVARGAGREREMAVRRALGVTWGRLAQQLLTESAVLSLAGGAAGILLAYTALPLLKPALPASMPRAGSIGLNGVVLGFAGGVSLHIGLLFGMLPALRPGGLTQSNRGVTARAVTGRLLVAGEVGLALMLLVGAGLLIESLRRAASVDLGFRKENVLTARMQLPKRRYPDAQRVRAFREQLLQRVQALPGVQQAGTVSSLPMGMIGQGADFEIEGRPETAREMAHASFANVSADYLEAMGIPLVAGRYFTAEDGPGAQPVAIVSEPLAREWWAGPAALGRRVRFDGSWFTVVGIVKGVRQSSPEREAVGHIYALNHQLSAAAQGNAMGRFNVLVIRTAPAAGPMAAAVRRVVAEIDRDQPVAQMETMEQVVDSRLESRQLDTLLLELFAGLAAALAAVGVFGAGSYAVARRTKEIGIRMALGATPGAVMKMVARETLLHAVAGALLGLAGTAATSRLLARFLFGVRPAEPAVVGVVAAALIAVVVGSGLIPARRAMRVDPTVALRED